MIIMCRGAAGDYICSAVNGVGHPAHATLTLTVLCESFDDHDDGILMYSDDMMNMMMTL